MSADQQRPPTGLKRIHKQRVTSGSVRLAEKVARFLITVGGIATIGAVTMIMVFLIWVVVPLFKSSEVGAARNTSQASGASAGAAALHLGSDEYQQLCWVLRGGGVIEVLRLDTGECLERHTLFPGQDPSAVSNSAENGQLVFALADGRLVPVNLKFSARLLRPEEIGPEIASLQPGASVNFSALNGPRGVAQCTGQGQFRFQSLVLTIGEAIPIAADDPVVLLDRSEPPVGSVFALLHQSGRLELIFGRKKTNMLTQRTTTTLSRAPIDYTQPAGAQGQPAYLSVSGAGDNLYLVWRDGSYLRFDLRNANRAVLAQAGDLVVEHGVQITALSELIGRTTLLVGDSTGRVTSWFRVKPPGADTVDGAILVQAGSFEGPATSVRSVDASKRSRLFCVGYEDGSGRIFYATSGDLRASFQTGQGESLQAVAFSPKEDGIVALSSHGLASWSFEAGYPEAGLRALFTKVWYEGYEQPEFVWQSSSGTDDSEPKFGLLPLIFGTLKATLYSMLFGVPIALLAALFTSEFLKPRVRSPIKSTIEMMASLPSVVLGFLVAIVIAPVIAQLVPATLAFFFVLPLTVLLGAHLWQLLPPKISLRLAGVPRFLAICAMLPLALYLAWIVGPFLERLLFSGDFLHWLNKQQGSATPGWMLLTLPTGGLVSFLLTGAFVAPWLRSAAIDWSHTRCAWFSLVQFSAGSVTAIAIAWLFAAILSAAGLDPRDSFLGTYVQRNTLVVGVVMGFAVIPIIYTLSEDALNSVPSSLRLASLGAGATPWQTAVRIVLPTAMSGLFSAVMVGLGRAVGETMIVLMATGNTPVMSWNIFNGFRTLSANIAVELPEAVQNSTHYRTLFLAALALFAMTFAVNTLAELVRQRFRRRAYQL